MAEPPSEGRWSHWEMSIVKEDNCSVQERKILTLYSDHCSVKVCTLKRGGVQIWATLSVKLTDRVEQDPRIIKNYAYHKIDRGGVGIELHIWSYGVQRPIIIVYLKFVHGSWGVKHLRSTHLLSLQHTAHLRILPDMWMSDCQVIICPYLLQKHLCDLPPMKV